MIPSLARVALFGVVAAALLALVAGPAEAQRRRRGRPDAPGTLVIVSAQEGAEVFVDEQRVGTTPIEPVPLSPGSHTLRVRLPGYTEYTDVVQITAGEPTEVQVDLFPLAHVLSIVTEPPGARVFVDGDFMGETPVEVDLLEGTRSIRITHRGFEDAIRQVHARAGTREELRVELVPLPPGWDAPPRPPEWYEEPITWIAIGGGAVALALAITIIAAATSSGPSEIDQFCNMSGGCIRLDPRW